MTHTTSAGPTRYPADITRGAGRTGRVRAVALLVVQVLLAAQFVGAGAGKVLGSEPMVAMFAEIGVGQWLRLLVGVLELAAAVGLLVPRLSRAAAAGLVLLMVGAAVTNVFVLGAAPVLPLLFGALAALVVAGRRTRPGATTLSNHAH